MYGWLWLNSALNRNVKNRGVVLAWMIYIAYPYKDIIASDIGC